MNLLYFSMFITIALLDLLDHNILFIYFITLLMISILILINYLHKQSV